MMNVWNEFQKRKRESYHPTEGFFYSATSVLDWDPYIRYRRRHPEQARQGDEPPAAVLAAWSALSLTATYQGQGPDLPRQALAIVYFFDRAFILGQQNIRLVPISEFRKRRRHYFEMAKQLRADAADQKRLGLYAVGWMEEAARAYEEMAEAPEPAPGCSLLVPRQPRGDPRLKSFVMLLADITKNVFGSPFYGSVATTANVVFSRDDLTFATVRKMLLSQPAHKSI
jgi:hypothetical protein